MWDIMKDYVIIESIKLSSGLIGRRLLTKPKARILTRRWRVRVLLVPNAPTVADLPPDSGLLGGGLRGGITSAVGRTVEYPPPQSKLAGLSGSNNYA
ncbi:hypothetical protein Hanom_Chr14g01277651 [Helianthus anomalus]